MRAAGDDGWLYFADGGDLVSIDLSQYAGVAFNELSAAADTHVSPGGGETFDEVIVDFLGISQNTATLYASTNKGQIIAEDIDYNDNDKGLIVGTSTTTIVNITQGNFSGLVMDFAEGTDKRIYWLYINNVNNVFLLNLDDYNGVT